MIARLLGVAAGVWLMFSPALFGYGGAAADSDRIAGPVAAAIAFVAIWPVTRALARANVPVGVWLLLAPLVLRPDGVAPILSSILSGMVIAVTALLQLDADQRFGGGWRTVRPAAWRRDGPVDRSSSRPA
ncbi:MAG: hypothetical protein AB7W59_31935 [Acidimicrobiia bacterium]